MIDNTTHDLSVMIDCLPDAPFKQRLAAAVEKLIAERDSKDLNWNSACKREIALLDERDTLRSAAEMALVALESLTRYFNIVRLGQSRLKDSEIRCSAHIAMKALTEALK